MRSHLVPTFALAAALGAPALAQQQPAQEQANNASSGQTGAMQALQDARQELQAAAQQLRQARQSGGQQATNQAQPEIQQAIDQIRQAMLQLSPEQRAKVQTNLRQAEQGLQVNNRAHSAAAIDRLVDVIAVVAVPVASAANAGTSAATTSTSAATAGATSDIEVVSSTDWNYDELYADGWRGEQLIDATVHGPTGEEIGEVENVIVGPDNKILSVIAEVGGVWDIGDTHVNVPWNEVTTEAGREGVTIPVTQETVENYSLFPDEVITAREARTETEAVDDDLTLGPRAWKLTNLVNDYVGLADASGYGYVDDVIFNKQGELKAVVVQPDVTWGTPGYYAYPYYGWGYGWDPTLDYYEVPYARDEVAGLDTFDYGEVDEEIATSN